MARVHRRRSSQLVQAHPAAAPLHELSTSTSLPPTTEALPQCSTPAGCLRLLSVPHQPSHRQQTAGAAVVVVVVVAAAAVVAVSLRDGEASRSAVQAVPATAGWRRGVATGPLDWATSASPAC
jgi:hypothetical protein